MLSSSRGAPKRAGSVRADLGRFLTGLSLLLAACTTDDGFRPEEGTVADPCVASTPIEIGSTAAGSLTAQDCVREDGRYGDRWALDVSGAMTVRVDLTSGEFDTFLEMYDASGIQIAMNDDSGGSLDSRIAQPLSPGRYVIVATSFGTGVTGSYQLTVQEAADCSPVGSVTVGETVSGVLSDDDCVWEYGTVADNWALSIASRQGVRIVMESSEFDEGVLIRDPYGTILYGAASNGPGEPARFDIELETGEYTIIATSPYDGMTGSYELTVAEPPPCTPGDPLVWDEEVAGALTDEDCTLTYWGAADTWSLELTQETAIVAVLKSLDFPPVIVARDAEGEEVAVGYDYSGTGTAVLDATLAAGAYQIMPTSYYDEARGGYRLTVSEATCEDAGAITFGETVSGALSETDCRRSDDQFRDVWTFRLDTATEVRFDLVSDDLDTYLILAGESGVLEENDDGGTGSNARIQRSLDAGDYEVVASSWGPYQMGAYRLTADAPPPPGAASAEEPVAVGKTVTPPGDHPARAPSAEPSRWWVPDVGKAHDVR